MTAPSVIDTREPGWWDDPVLDELLEGVHVPDRRSPCTALSESARQARLRRRAARNEVTARIADIRGTDEQGRLR